MTIFLQSSNFLETVAAEIEKNDEAARQLTTGLSESQLNWTPSPERWSIAQCLDHLAVTSSQFKNDFNRAIARGRQKWPTRAPVAYKPSFVGGWLIKQVVPEATRRVPAPKVFRPSTSAIADPLGRFLNQQKEFLTFVQQAEVSTITKCDYVRRSHH
ncbi:MAG: DinB family protein [Pyrinomonadaceae bacterium]